MLDHFVNLNSRYATDFEELEEIGRGGFGIVYKARHRLDGNIYAIKKIKLSDKDREENKRIRREITYLSSLNNQYIVRYFQTWVEHETDKAIIENFDEWLEDDEEDSEYDDASKDNDSYEMKWQEIPDEEAFAPPTFTPEDRKALMQQRSSSMTKGHPKEKRKNSKNKDALPFQGMAEIDRDLMNNTTTDADDQKRSFRK